MDRLGRLTAIILAATLLGGCCFDERDCESSVPLIGRQITLLNFSAAETDTVVVKVYLASSNFTNPIDSVVYSGVTNHQPADTADSTSCVLSNPGLGRNIADNLLNYTIYLPADNLTYKITNVTESVTYCKPCTQTESYYMPTGYSVNGVRDTISGLMSWQGIVITK